MFGVEIETINVDGCKYIKYSTLYDDNTQALFLFNDYCNQITYPHISGIDLDNVKSVSVKIFNTNHNSRTILKLKKFTFEIQEQLSLF